MIHNCLTPAAEYAPKGIYTFHKTLWLNCAGTGRVKIFTAGRYVLYINDRYICEGPCRGHREAQYYDEIETDAFRSGENRITVRVLHINDRSSFTSVFFGAKPELIFQAQLGGLRIASDESWSCALDQRCILLPPKYRSLPPYEKVDFMQNALPLALKAKKGFDFDAEAPNFYGIHREYALKPRPIPMILPGETVALRIVKCGDGYIDLDAGRYITAKIELKLKPNWDVRLTYGECYETSSGKRMRDDTDGEIQGYFDEFHTGQDEAVYSPFWFRAFRYIRIQAQEPEACLEGLSVRLFHYPMDGDAGFSCSDPKYNRMYEISLHTMQCCTQETFTDCPYHEQLQYVMDSAIEGAVMLRLTGDTRMVRKCIAEYAISQLPDGLLQARYPSSTKQIIPGFGFFWVFLLQDYLEATADTAFVRQQIGTMDRLFGYFDANLSSLGLITASPYWDFVDWVNGWEKGVPSLQPGEAHTIYNMYYACALLCAGDICEKLGRTGLAAEYRQRYETLCGRIRAQCYDPVRGLYRDGAITGGYSMHTIIWAILSELETGENAQKMLSRLNEPGLSATSFAMNYYLFLAFEKCGQPEKIFQNLEGWRKMMDMHCSTWCENPDDPRSECHGWSSAPIYAFSTHLLGVKITTEDKILIRPVTAGLDWAQGTVPTRFGPVFVEWKKKEGGLSANVKAPEGVLKQLCLPNGVRQCFTEASFLYDE